MTSQEILVALIGVALVFYLFWPKPKGPKKKTKHQIVPVPQPMAEEEKVPANAIVLDGSNVMHWGGDPSTKVLAKVVHQLENKGLAPIVIFDASAGYQVSDHFMNERELARLINVAANRVCVVHKGVIADEVILDFATEHALRVVTNDHYRDWASRFPIVKKKGRLIKGSYKDGNVAMPTL